MQQVQSGGGIYSIVRYYVVQPPPNLTDNSHSAVLLRVPQCLHADNTSTLRCFTMPMTHGVNAPEELQQSAAACTYSENKQY